MLCQAGPGPPITAVRSSSLPPGGWVVVGGRTRGPASWRCPRTLGVLPSYVGALDFAPSFPTSPLHATWNLLRTLSSEPQFLSSPNAHCEWSRTSAPIRGPLPAGPHYCRAGGAPWVGGRIPTLMSHLESQAADPWNRDSWVSPVTTLTSLLALTLARGSAGVWVVQRPTSGWQLGPAHC